MDRLSMDDLDHTDDELSFDVDARPAAEPTRKSVVLADRLTPTGWHRQAAESRRSRRRTKGASFAPGPRRRQKG